MPSCAAEVDRHGDPLPDGAVARLGSERFFHPFGLSCLAFSPDSRVLVAAGHAEKGLSLRFWEIATGRQIASFAIEPNHTSIGRMLLWGVQFAPDGKHLAINTVSGIDIVNWRAGRTIRSFGSGDVISCAFSPDGNLVVGGSLLADGQGAIRVWEFVTGRELTPFRDAGGSLRRLRFAPDGRRLLSGPTRLPSRGDHQGQRGSISIWDVESRKKLHEIDHDSPKVAFSPDGATIAYEKDGIRIVDALTGTERTRLAARDASIAFSPDGRSIISWEPAQGLQLWNVATGRQIRRFTGPIGPASALAGFSPDGKLLAMMCGETNQTGAFRLWNVATGEEIHPFDGHRDAINHLAYAPGGKLLASASRDATVRLWDPVTGRQVRCLTGHADGVLAVAFSRDGTTLASISSSTTRVWDVASGKQRAVFQNPAVGKSSSQPPHPMDTAALAFSADGRSLTAAGSNGMLVTWDIVSTKESQRIVVAALGRWHPSIATDLLPVRQLALTANYPPERSSLPERVDVLRVNGGKTERSIRLRESRDKATELFCVALAASPDEALFASSEVLKPLFVRRDSIPSVRIWDRFTGKEAQQIHTVAEAMAFSPNCETLATDANAMAQSRTITGQIELGYRIYLWDILTGKLRAKLAGHTDAVRCVAFSPDGTYLASGSVDRTILVWKTAARPPAANVRPDQVRAWWDNLAGEPPAAITAMAHLVRHPGASIPLIRSQLKAVQPPDPKRVATLIKELDSAEYATRERARLALDGLAELAEPGLRVALSGTVSLEVRRRILLQLERAGVIQPNQLQVLRAITVLQRVGSQEAQEVLESLARGVPDSRVTREAKAALQHWTR
jgi:WD40 repeat protein